MVLSKKILVLVLKKYGGLGLGLGLGVDEKVLLTRSLLVTAQLVLRVILNAVSYACIAVSWQV